MVVKVTSASCLDREVMEMETVNASSDVHRKEGRGVHHKVGREI